MSDVNYQTAGSTAGTKPAVVLNPYQALAAISEAGEAQLRRKNNRWDTMGDVFALSGGLVPFVAVISTLVTFESALLPSMVGAFVAAVAFGAGAVTCWLRSGKVMGSEDVLRMGLTAIGGVGSLPAELATRCPSETLGTATDQYLELMALTAEEELTFKLLQEEGFAGSFDELINVCRALNRA